MERIMTMEVANTEGCMTMEPPMSIKAIAEARISKTLAKALRQAKPKKALFPWRTKPVVLDLSDMDLDDDMLAELFEACTGKNKELAHIDYIDLSGNPRLTKLPGHLAWCTGLWELELGDTAIAALPDWVHGLKHITVHKHDEVLFKAVLPMPQGTFPFSDVVATLPFWWSRVFGGRDLRTGRRTAHARH